MVLCRTSLRRFQKRLLITTAVVGILLLTVPQSEEKWYEKNRERLAEIKITPKMISNARPWIPMGSKWQNGLPGYEGIIPIGKDSGVYIATHSAHRNSTFGCLLFRLIHGSHRKYVSDAILAVDQQGSFYKNDGHVCGWLILKSNKEVNTLEDFLATWVGKNSKWKPYSGS